MELNGKLPIIDSPSVDTTPEQNAPHFLKGLLQNTVVARAKKRESRYYTTFATDTILSLGYFSLFFSSSDLLIPVLDLQKKMGSEWKK